jgi:hypothetical protein
MKEKEKLSGPSGMTGSSGMISAGGPGFGSASGPCIGISGNTGMCGMTGPSRITKQDYREAKLNVILEEIETYTHKSL